MANEYVVKIQYDNVEQEQSTNPIDVEKKTQSVHASPERLKQKTQSNDMLKTLRNVTVVYGLSRQAAQMGVQYQSTTASIQGNSLKAERMQTKFNNVSNNIGLGLGVTASLLTGNPIVMAVTAYALAQRAFNLANETRKYQAQLSLERYQAQYYQNRLIKDISEVR